MILEKRKKNASIKIKSSAQKGLSSFSRRTQTSSLPAAQGVYWAKVSVYSDFNFEFPPFSPHLPAGMQISKQNTH